MEFNLSNAAISKLNMAQGYRWGSYRMDVTVPDKLPLISYTDTGRVNGAVNREIRYTHVLYRFVPGVNWTAERLVNAFLWGR